MSNIVLNNIKNRRSIRSYKNERIKEVELNQILEAGIYAPSALNQQSSIIVAIRNDDIYNQLCELTEKYFPNRKPYFYGCKDIVIVFADDKALCPIENGSLVLENMFLAAQSLNIGSCWIHYLRDLFKTDEGKVLQEELEIPENYFVVGTCILGYALETPVIKNRKENYIKVIK